MDAASRAARAARTPTSLRYRVVAYLLLPALILLATVAVVGIWLRGKVTGPRGGRG